jgi:mono/diheme cytochrome c family protein
VGVRAVAAGVVSVLVLALAGCSKGEGPPVAGPGSGPAPTAREAAAPAGAMPDGAALFDAHCSRCHGPQGTGSDQGPPLVHKVYEPAHHPDGAFYRAVRQGVRAHHWNFGDMPKVGGLSDAEVAEVIAYVRERKRAAGIFQ